MNEFFDLVRPIIEFSFDTVLARSNNIFEVMTNEPIEALLKAGGVAINTSQQENDDDMGESAFSHFCKKKIVQKQKFHVKKCQCHSPPFLQSKTTKKKSFLKKFLSKKN